MKTETAIQYLLQILARGRFNYVNEIRCQDQIAEYFNCLKMSFEREYQLGNRFVDFYLPNSGLALEIKASKNWSKIKVYRQCEYYCSFKDIKGLVLATAKAQSLPKFIQGKPVSVFSLGVCLL